MATGFRSDALRRWLAERTKGADGTGGEPPSTEATTRATETTAPPTEEARIPSSPTEPGSRVVAPGFFDQFPLFSETSPTASRQGRLNLRHQAMIGDNLDIFEGARVLDIASHDGRWSFAALQAGSASVVGLEGRPELIENANETFEKYGIDPARYRFVGGDLFHTLAEEQGEFDVVLCLGFLYHTLRYNELFARIRQLNPKYLIIDTQVARGEHLAIRLRVEDAAFTSNAVADDFAHEGRVLTGRPTVNGLEAMTSAYGFELERYSDWAGLLRDNPEDGSHCETYSDGTRVTARFKSVT